MLLATPRYVTLDCVPKLGSYLLSDATNTDLSPRTFRNLYNLHNIGLVSIIINLNRDVRSMCEGVTSISVRSR